MKPGYRTACGCFISGVYLLVMAEAYAAPPQLLNKTVTMAFTGETTQRDPSGSVRQHATNIKYVVYISSAGRLFERSSRSAGSTGGRGGMRSKTGENEPGAGQTKGGEARGLRFEGNKLVAYRGYAGAGGAGAARIVASFDSGYSSCTVDVSLGKEGGVIKRKGLDGVVREFLSFSATNKSCSIQEGNAFASQ